MYRFFLALIILSGFLSQAFAGTRPIVTRTPIYSPYYQRNYAPCPNYRSRNMFLPARHNASIFPDISDLEKYSMNRSFSGENDIQRLQRLEMQAFGAIQQGDIQSRYENVRGAILARPKDNYKTSLLRGIGNYFAGQMTGYTPSLGSSSPFNNSGFSYYPYPTTYDNTAGVEFSSPFHSGYRVNNYSTGSSSGVRILD